MVRKDGVDIVSRQIGNKAVMTVRTDDGTTETAVPDELRERPAITDEQVRQAAQLATALETEMGWPVDVECAWHNDALYLLQCRPITTLS